MTIHYWWQKQPLRGFLLMLVLLIATTSFAVASSFLTSSITVVKPLSKRSKTRYYNQLLRIPRGGGNYSSNKQQIFEKERTELDASSENFPDFSNTEPVVPPTAFLGRNAHSPPGFLRSRFPKFPWSRLPNLLTYVRCFAIPLFVGLFYMPISICDRSNIYTGSVFALASLTDWFDGFLARRWDISSSFGAFLDPVADKLMVSTSLVLLSGKYGAIVAIPTLIILAREIAVSALREWMAQRGERDVVKVGYQGKLKTALTMPALALLLFFPASSFSDVFYKVGVPLLYLSTVLTITSGSVYFIAALPALLGSKK
jgi:CDP-diacylglycerol--glycerol-3-phosphate 3-phosphatidyltransferase